MHLRNLLAAVVCLVLPFALIGGEPGKLRELDTKGAKIEFERGKVTAPKTITTAEELTKAIPASDAITKQVDFGREKLVLFAWGGSGGDKLSAKMSDDGKTVNFSYTPGLTRDFRPHIHLWAIPKAAEFKIDTGRGK